MRSTRSDTGHPEDLGDRPDAADEGNHADHAPGAWRLPASCLTVQVDLSAMADGELDPAGVRTALAHADLCDDCAAFAASVRSQLGLHRALFAPAQAPVRRAVGSADELRGVVCRDRTPPPAAGDRAGLRGLGSRF